jgi:hypothetical protein
MAISINATRQRRNLYKVSNALKIARKQIKKNQLFNVAKRSCVVLDRTVYVPSDDDFIFFIWVVNRSDITDSFKLAPVESFKHSVGCFKLRTPRESLYELVRGTVYVIGVGAEELLKDVSAPETPLWVCFYVSHLEAPDFVCTG